MSYRPRRFRLLDADVPLAEIDTFERSHLRAWLEAEIDAKIGQEYTAMSAENCDAPEFYRRQGRVTGLKSAKLLLGAIRRITAARSGGDIPPEDGS